MYITPPLYMSSNRMHALSHSFLTELHGRSRMSLECSNSKGVHFSSAAEAMTKMSELGSRQDNNVPETDVHSLICLAAQLALEVRSYHQLTCHEQALR